jgi:hypothetical protein
MWNETVMTRYYTGILLKEMGRPRNNSAEVADV